MLLEQASSLLCAVAAANVLHVRLFVGQLQQISKQRPEGFWQQATKQINVRSR